MEELELELYRGPINPIFNDLPGYIAISDQIYWAVLISQPSPDSDPTLYLYT